MEVITDLSKVNIENAIVTLGKFDGSHIGHQRLFEIAISRKQPGWPVVIFTFDVPVAEIVGSERDGSVRTIQTQTERLLQDYPEGIDDVVIFPFNETTRNMTPEAFVKEVLVSQLHVKIIVVGVDFCFGKNRSGNVETLKTLGETYGFEVIAVEKVRFRIEGEEQEVSSTLIKQEIRKGNLSDVRAMLGRPFAVTGEVLHGKHYGRTIGFPTLNQAAPEEKILPPNGVYATRVCIDGKEYPSITNVGVRPTFDDGEHRTVETHMLDHSEDLYGKNIRVDFYSFIRPEQKFASAEELKEKIQNDILRVKEYFAGEEGTENAEQ